MTATEPALNARATQGLSFVYLCRYRYQSWFRPGAGPIGRPSLPAP
jgi:hypothetical protein